MPQVLEYLATDGKSPYALWFNSLSAEAAAKITAHKLRLEQGNKSNVDPVGEGVFEKKIDWGPGYRVYFANDGNEVILLLGGGTKARQPADIQKAKECWRDYKERKRQALADEQKTKVQDRPPQRRQPKKGKSRKK